MIHSLWNTLVAAMTSWHEWKLFLEHSISISNDALHILAGVLLWVVLGLMLRRPLSSSRPWLWLFAGILCNEVVDLWVERWPNPGQQYGEGAKDLLLTMAVPTLIMVAARFRPDLFRRGLGRRRA